MIKTQYLNGDEQNLHKIITGYYLLHKIFFNYMEQNIHTIEFPSFTRGIKTAFEITGWMGQIEFLSFYKTTKNKVTYNIAGQSPFLYMKIYPSNALDTCGSIPQPKKSIPATTAYSFPIQVRCYTSHL